MATTRYRSESFEVVTYPEGTEVLNLTTGQTSWFQGDDADTIEEGISLHEATTSPVHVGVDSYLSQYFEPLRCLNHSDDCKGTVQYRVPLSGTGVPFPRCDHHWDLRLKEQERINRVYPDSPIAPDWFDPADAGETWDTSDEDIPYGPGW